MVLMLEPLFACNLHCQGCGRVREYADCVTEQMSLDECLSAAEECKAPIVSLCGGEPLLYRPILPLITELARRGKFLYLCTNGQLLAGRMPEIAQLGSRTRKKLMINVHLDGPPELHDAMTGAPGSFYRALAGINAAKKVGLPVYTNTTVYKSTTVDQLIALGDILVQAHIDGMMISPGYGYDAVRKEQSKSSPESFFMTRAEVHAFFLELEQRMKRYPLTATGRFRDFLTGRADLTCAAWANPTRNVRGWRRPCYLIADGHAPSWRQLMDETDWSHFNGQNDARCRDCMTHCGYEPAAVLTMLRFK